MSKRLTDAECAAEYWRAKCEWVTAQEYAEVVVWHRFASHPHAHEPEESFSSRMARKSIEAMEAKWRDES